MQAPSPLYFLIYVSVEKSSLAIIPVPPLWKHGCATIVAMVGTHINIKQMFAPSKNTHNNKQHQQHQTKAKPTPQKKTEPKQNNTKWIKMKAPSPLYFLIYVSVEKSSLAIIPVPPLWKHGCATIVAMVGTHINVKQMFAPMHKTKAKPLPKESANQQN